MTERSAKRQLREMLDSFTAGSVLHLLADLYRTSAEESRRQGDARAYRKFRMVESTLVVVGLGLDAALPR